MFDYTRKSFFLFIVLSVISSYILFVNLDNLSVRMWDEARNGINAIEMLQNGKLFVTHFDGQPDMWNSKPPFMIWMIALSMKFFGITTFALRLPSVLAALTVIIYGFILFRKKTQYPDLGFYAGIVLITSIGFIDYHAARDGDFDTMLAMWIFIYTTQFYYYVIERKKIHLIIFAFALGMGILTKGIAACMILPGLLLFLFTDKKNLSLFKSPSFYIIPILGILLGLSYYLIRENLNPGYIDAVITNEITGRYSETNEGHTGTVWYYYELLRDQHFKFWFYTIPISLIIVFTRGSSELKKIIGYITIVATTYYVVITISHTKLPWYDIPLYPFFSIIIAGGIVQLKNEVFKLNFINSLLLKALLFSICILALLFAPFQSILATSIRAEKETYYPELFYGDFINYYYQEHPNQKQLYVSSEGYNPHLIFYIKEKATKGKKIEIIHPFNYNYKVNDTILFTEKSFVPKPKEGLFLDTILFVDNTNVIVRIVDSSILIKDRYDKAFKNKINEIKSSPDWLNSIKIKAEKNNIDLEKQIMLDALWTLEQSNTLNKEQVDSLKTKYEL